MASHSLPEDLLLDVLGRLSVKTLIRCKCVSKSWSGLIDSQEFIRIHLNRSLMDSKAQKILVEGCYSPYELFYGDCDSPDNFIASTEKLYHPYPRENVTLVGSCNGLLCMKYSKSGVVLCNSWTKKHHKLPYKPIEIELPEGWRRDYSLYGFGYDDVNDDYKVVKLVGLEDKFSSSFSNEIQVYSQKSNSWKRIEDFPYPILKHYPHCNGVHVNSALHWMWRSNALGHNFSPADYSIMAIDLRTDKHRAIPVPDFSGNMNNLRVLNGWLSVVSIQNFYNVNVWVMKDYGVVDSWTKLIFRHSDFCLFPSPIFVPYPEGKKQLVFHNRRDLIWYDMDQEVFEKINIVPGRVSEPFIKLGYSVVSLVPPHAG